MPTEPRSQGLHSRLISACQPLDKYWGQLGLSPGVYRRLLRTFPLAVPLFLTKGALVRAQADFLVISSASLAF